MNVYYVMGGEGGAGRGEKRGIHKKTNQNPTIKIQLLLVLKVKLKL